MGWTAKDTARALAAGLYGPGDDLTRPPPGTDAKRPTWTSSGQGLAEPDQAAVNAIQTDLARLGAKQTKLASSDLNFIKPPLQSVANGQQKFYDAAPTPLKRLLGSPLALTGEFARGPQKERQVGGGGYFGAPRNFTRKNEKLRGIHPGLDFSAPCGEAVYACADGVVTFVGCQTLGTRRSIKGPHQDIRDPTGKKWQFILDAQESVVLRRVERNIGDGGIFVIVAHTGDFQGYQTEYFHLESVAVEHRQKITEGALIGYVGTTAAGIIGPHLHFQVRLVGGAIVNPTTLVPNYKKGGPDSSTVAGSSGVVLPLYASTALQVAASQGANMLNASARGTAILNQGTATIKQNMSTHAQNIAQTTAVQEAALASAATATNATALSVTTPMTFDFDRGTWTDGRPT